MKPSAIIRWTPALAGVLGLALLAGCAAGIITPTAYEYRYRVFEAKEPLPADMKAPISEELLNERFLGLGILNRSMDLLAQDGFELWKIKRVDSTNNYTFTFRRRIPAGWSPTPAPMEFTGIYQAQPPYETTTFYSLAPRYRGYTVGIFKQGAEAQFIDANWNGDVLTAQEGNTQHTFMLSGDGLTLSHVRDGLEPQKFERSTMNLLRVQSGK
ncbi:MAG: hypothetical protein M1457_08995 [bacterium]|nr:hypothetical protein [bacterium]